MTAHVDAARRQHVTAVIVSHNGERWLPRLIDALAGSTRQPDRIIAVDTGSADGSRRLLSDAFGSSAVLDAGPTTGFGAAVGRALAVADRETGGVPEVETADDRWVWLLHDDCAPTADALERLVETGAGGTSIGVVGCRVRAWPSGRRLLEVGATITGTGHRETGVEPGEYDQGQYDDQRDVLSVSSAAMLVRRSLWDRLGGFDPLLPLFGDDLDFGWRSATLGQRVVVAAGAVVFHAEAAARGVRPIACTARSPQRAARCAAVFILLANCRGRALPWQYVRLAAGSLLRALGFLLGKLPGAAWSELAAAASVLGRPGRIAAARSRRRSVAGANSTDPRGLRPRWWTPYANGVDAVLGLFAGREAAGGLSATRLLRTGRGDAAALETGPAPDEAVNLPMGSGPVNSALAHPLLALAGVLAIAGLLASRGLWGTGFLQGGGLLPAPDSAAGWWQQYAAAEHQVRLGSTQPAAPYVVALALLGTLLLGKAWLVVDLVMLFSPVLAAAGAFVASGCFVRSRPVRTWMAATYSLLPVLTGAASAGRVGTVVATIMLPWLVLPTASLLRTPGRPRVRHLCGSAALLALMCAFAPIAGVVAGALLVAALPWLLVRRRAAAAGYAAAALLLATALLLPWSLRFVDDPALLLTEAGVGGAPNASGGAPAWQTAMGRLGAPDQAPWWLTVALFAAALLALLRATSRPRVAAAWAAVAVALGGAALMSRQVVQAPGTTHPTAVWLGLPLVVAQAAAIVAAGLGADGMTRDIGSVSFGWRQPLAAVGVALAVAVSVGGLVWQVATAPHGDLQRRPSVALPAYMVDTMQSMGGRVLVLRGTARAARYDVLAGDGVRLGDESVLPPLAPSMTAAVTALLTPGQAGTADPLRRRGIRYVVLPRSADPALAAGLDAVGGLTRASTGGLLTGWQVDGTTGAGGVRSAPAAEATTTDSASPAALDPATTMSADAGGARTWQLLGQAALWLVVLLGAVPGISRRTDPTEDAT